MKTTVLAFCSLISISAFSAIPKVSVEEVLSLPEGNRQAVAQSQAEDFFKSVMNVAFDEKQPMSIRWKAVMLATELGRKKNLEDLQKASRHSQWYLRNAALIAVKDIDEEAAFDMAKVLVKDKALVVRSAAVDTLSQLKRGEVRDLLWEEISQKYNFRNNQSLWIRPKMAEILARSPLPFEKTMFAQMLSDKDLLMQRAAVMGLEKISGVTLGDKKATLSKKVALWKKEANKL